LEVTLALDWSSISRPAVFRGQRPVFARRKEVVIGVSPREIAWRRFDAMLDGDRADLARHAYSEAANRKAEKELPLCRGKGTPAPYATGIMLHTAFTISSGRYTRTRSKAILSSRP
jgi:hypothetical protein